MVTAQQTNKMKALNVNALKVGKATTVKTVSLINIHIFTNVKAHCFVLFCFLIVCLFVFSDVLSTWPVGWGGIPCSPFTSRRPHFVTGSAAEAKPLKSGPS